MLSSDQLAQPQISSPNRLNEALPQFGVSSSSSMEFNEVKVEPSESSDIKVEPMKSSVKVEPNKTADPLRLLCSICGKVCWLGSWLRCCQVQVCDACAKKTVRETSKCWKCGDIAYLDHVLEDEELRKRAFEWKQDLATGAPVKCSLCHDVLQ